MANIPNAKRSPRIVNGVIYWFEGDTFTITIKLNLEDQDGEPIDVESGDTVTVEFLNSRREVVKTFTFDGPLYDNKIEMEFDDTVTALFHRGKHTYNIYYNGENRTTIADENVCVVE